MDTFFNYLESKFGSYNISEKSAMVNDEESIDEVCEEELLKAFGTSSK